VYNTTLVKEQGQRDTLEDFADTKAISPKEYPESGC
jgi:hypothetical protein